MGIPNSRERSRLNNLKSRMLFTCKKFFFRLCIEKKTFAPENGGIPLLLPLSLRLCKSSFRSQDI